MNPLSIAVFASVGLIALVVIMSLLRDIFDERSALTREQRRREDIARREQSAREERDLWLNIGAGIADPLGLFH